MAKTEKFSVYKAFIDERHKFNLTKNQADQIYSTLTDIIARAIKNEEVSIAIKDVGIFDIRTQKPRVARNVKTGERIDVPEKKALRFKPCKALKDIVSNK